MQKTFAKNYPARKRRSIGTGFSMCVQPSFIIGTNNEDGSDNFAPITWVSATCEKDDYLIVISMFGSKRTKQNVVRIGIFSANLVSVDMLALMDYPERLEKAMELGALTRDDLLLCARRVLELILKMD